MGDADLKPWFWQFYVLLSMTGLGALITTLLQRYNQDFPY